MKLVVCYRTYFNSLAAVDGRLVQVYCSLFFLSYTGKIQLSEMVHIKDKIGKKNARYFKDILKQLITKFIT